MSILKRLRERLASVREALRDPDDPTVEKLGLSAEIPAASGAPLWKLDLQMQAQPHGDGEKLRVRAHFQTNFGSVLKPLQGPQPADEAPALPGADRRLLTRTQRVGVLATRAASRALRTPLIRAIAEPILRRDFNTWIEVQASTASLDKGAQDLVPAQEQLARLGIQPGGVARNQDGPVAESWAGEAPGGFAQVSLLQLDKRHLPPRLARSFGERPFSLAAAIVNVVEEK